MSKVKTRGPSAINPESGVAPATGWHKQLRDGISIWIRPISEQDAELELEFLKSLSPEARKLRFFGLVHEPSIEVARELTRLDPTHAAAFIAVASLDGREQQIGAAHYRTNEKGDSCDCSVTLDDAWRRRGIGTLLMRYLIDDAKSRGIRHMCAFAPADSDDNSRLAGRLGFERRPDVHDPATVVYHLSVG